MDDKPLDLSKTSSRSARESQSPEKSQESEKELEKSPTYERVSSHEGRREFSKPIGKSEGNIEKPCVTSFVGSDTSAVKDSPYRGKRPSPSKIVSPYTNVWTKPEKSSLTGEKSPTYERVSSHEGRRELFKPIGKSEENIEKPCVTSFIGSDTSARKESPYRGKRPSPSKIVSPYKKVCTKPEESSLAGKKILEFSQTSRYHKIQEEETLVSKDVAESYVVNERKVSKNPALNLESKSGQSFESSVVKKKHNPKKDDSEGQKVASGICTCSGPSTSTSDCSLHSTDNRKSTNESSVVKNKENPKKDDSEERRVALGICTSSGPSASTRDCSFHSTDNRKYKAAYVCKYCNRNWKSNLMLERHVRTHTGEKPFECQHCQKKFRTESYLREHILRLHAADRPFKCTECDRAFSTSAFLKRHVKYHNSRFFRCTECDKSYVTKSELNRHMRTHQNYRPYPCPECESRFTRKIHLSRHMVIHSGKRPFKCNECNSSYNSPYLLRMHERLHPENMPYKCAICGKTFRYELQLTFHELTHR